MDQIRADWVFYGATSAWAGQEPLGPTNDIPRMYVDVANSGNGPGYEVRVLGLGCRARIARVKDNASLEKALDVIPVWPSSESYRIVVYCDPSEWDQARVALSWRQRGPWKLRPLGRWRDVAISGLSGAPARPVHLSEKEIKAGREKLKGSFQRDHQPLSKWVLVRAFERFKLRTRPAQPQQSHT